MNTSNDAVRFEYANRQAHEVGPCTEVRGEDGRFRLVLDVRTSTVKGHTAIEVADGLFLVPNMTEVRVRWIA